MILSIKFAQLRIYSEVVFMKRHNIW